MFGFVIEFFELVFIEGLFFLDILEFLLLIVVYIKIGSLWINRIIVFFFYIIRFNFMIYIIISILL